MTEIEVRELAAGALRGVSLAVAKGEIYAVLGRYGAGKTTLLEVVSGHRRPEAGAVRVGGVDPYAQREAVRMGTVWQDGGLFPGLTVAEVVDTWRRWTLDPLSRDDALRMVGLSGAAHRRFERLTASERRRLDLALALVGRSDVLFLDEPATASLWTTLRSLAGQGVTVLLTTRDRQEALRADRYGVLDEGRLLKPVRHAA